MIETNQFIDGVNLTDRTSLIHLLSNDDRDDSKDNNEPDMIKQDKTLLWTRWSDDLCAQSIRLQYY